MLKHTKFSIGLASLLLAFRCGSYVRADTPHPSAETERAARATHVLTEIMEVPESSIPERLMSRAHGIAVIPHVVKGAFVFGGQGGKGLISQRREDGTWSSPSFVQIGGGSFGPQIGVQSTDMVLVFTDEDCIRGLLKGKLKLGADASVAAGPIGRKAEIGTDIMLKSGVFAYSRSKGLFAGISLDGSVIKIDDEANSRAYGRELSAERILFGRNLAAGPSVQGFVRTLQDISPPHSHDVRPARRSE